MDGVEGILVGCDSPSKLVISIELIQRSLAVSVYNFDVEPVGSCAGTTVRTSKREPWPDCNASASIIPAHNWRRMPLTADKLVKQPR